MLAGDEENNMWVTQIVLIGISPARVVRGLSEKGPRCSCWRAGAEKGGREKDQRQSWELGKAVAVLRSNEEVCVSGC